MTGAKHDAGDAYSIWSTGLGSHTSTQCMDLIEIFDIQLDIFTIYFAYFKAVEIPLCIVCARTCFLESSSV